VAGQADAFEEHVATPHGLDFAHAAQFYGCTFARPTDLESLRAAVTRSVGEPGTTIVEVVTDRRENLALHRRIAELVIPPGGINRLAPEAAPGA
jgi:2-succinyl-5-enolpyruvyl-6-hydroxy-3-cyclohexene-1-carboxylate synthase